MQLAEARVLYEEMDASSPTRYASFASLSRCPNNDLLLVERVGSEKNSADGRLRLWRSTDAGNAWAQEPAPFDLTPSGMPGEFRTAELSLIDSQRMAMYVTWIDHPPGDPPLANPKTEGILPIHIGWASSGDSGRSWTALRPIPVSPLVQPCGNGKLLRLPDRSLLAGFETYKHYDDPSPWSARSAFVVSQDDGRTWDPPRITAQDPELNICYWDHHITLLKSGALLDVLWADDRRKPGVSEILAMISRDGGATWSPPRPLGIAGQFSHIVQLSDGRLLMFYVVRTGEPSIRVRCGSEDGMRWDDRDAMVLYSHSADDLRKARDGGFTDYLVSMSVWTFGWPTAVEVSPGEVLAAYYTVHGTISSNRIVRLRL